MFFDELMEKHKQRRAYVRDAKRAASSTNVNQMLTSTTASTTTTTTTTTSMTTVASASIFSSMSNLLSPLSPRGHSSNNNSNHNDDHDHDRHEDEEETALDVDDDELAQQYKLDLDMTAMLIEMSITRMCHFGVELGVAQEFVAHVTDITRLNDKQKRHLKETLEILFVSQVKF